MKAGYYEEECPKCCDGIVKSHKILSNEQKLECLTCGYKQKYAVI